MKIILFICLITLFTITQTKSQKNDTVSIINPVKLDGEGLLLKSKKQKTVAWILCGTGSALLLGGMLDVRKNALSGSDFWGFAALAGTLLDLSSIPFFISSAKNKRKANLILKNEKVFFNHQINTNENFVAAVIKINL